ncbi:MAG: D-alanyl-D-alanine carboxypeptidase family protein [Paracoccaceae bacterium]
MRIAARTVMVIAGLLLATRALALETEARSMLVMDHSSGIVLFAKNEAAPLPPASMSKLMTLYMVFEALREGRLALDTEFRVSEKAWKMGGSKMFVEVGNQVSVEDLLRGIIIASGNDACIVIAEGMSGTERAFADAMTKRARELGMMDSTFRNATGWPHPEHLMSARDLVLIAGRIVSEFPEYYHYFAEKTFTWAGITQPNRNPLLFMDIGADGLKTGHTRQAGYGLVGSAERDGRRVVFAFTGMTSERARSQEAERIVSWSFREFRSQELFKAGAEIARAELWLGQEATVPLVPLRDVTIVRPYGKDPVKASVVYRGPIPTPVGEGQELAELRLEIPGLAPVSIPLAAGHAVPRGGFVARLKASARLLAGKALSLAGQEQN